MNAISPKEAAKLNDTTDQAEFERIVNKVNNYLKSSYHTGATLTISARTIDEAGVKVGLMVIDEFSKAGWKLEYVSDQRDGDFYFMKAQGDNYENT